MQAYTPKLSLKGVEGASIVLLDSMYAIGALTARLASEEGAVVAVTPSVAHEVSRLSGVKKDEVASAFHIVAPEFPLIFDERGRVRGFKFRTFRGKPEWKEVQRICAKEWGSLSPADREVATAALWLAKKWNREMVTEKEGHVFVVTEDGPLRRCLEKISRVTKGVVKVVGDYW